MESERRGLSEGKLLEKAVVVIGADSSIGQILIPELLEKYKTVILTERGKGCPDFSKKIEEYWSCGKFRTDCAKCILVIS